jgi:hypothetical protein
VTTESEKEAYKLARRAMRNLREGRDFEWWKDYGAAMLAAQGEAMRESGSNQPAGRAYNYEHNIIMRREKLIDYTVDPPFPDKNTRSHAMQMVDNLDVPRDTRRGKGILAWRKGLTLNEQTQLNHPTAILRKWKADTEPQEEKEAKRKLKGLTEKKTSPHLDLIADTEGERDAARRHAENLRGLLGRVLKEVDDLAPDLREAITRALAE